MADQSDNQNFLDNASVIALAKMYKDSLRDNVNTVTNSNAKGQRAPQYFYGTIVNTGPLGTEADYTDARYWVQRQLPSNSGGAVTDAATFTAATTPIAQTFTATNMSEIAYSTHSIRVGTVVKIFWEFDFTTPNPTPRHLIESPSPGLIPVSIYSTGGSDGAWDGGTSTFTFPSYTYNATDVFNSNSLGTGLTPVMRLFRGSCAAASNGMGYFHSGAFVLLFTDESPNVDPCDNYDGATGDL